MGEVCAYLLCQKSSYMGMYDSTSFLDVKKDLQGPKDTD